MAQTFEIDSGLSSIRFQPLSATTTYTFHNFPFTLPDGTTSCIDEDAAVATLTMTESALTIAYTDEDAVAECTISTTTFTLDQIPLTVSSNDGMPVLINRAQFVDVAPPTVLASGESQIVLTFTDMNGFGAELSIGFEFDSLDQMPTDFTITGGTPTKSDTTWVYTPPVAFTSGALTFVLDFSNVLAASIPARISLLYNADDDITFTHPLGNTISFVPTPDLALAVDADEDCADGNKDTCTFTLNGVTSNQLTQLTIEFADALFNNNPAEDSLTNVVYHCGPDGTFVTLPRIGSSMVFTIGDGIAQLSPDTESSTCTFQFTKLKSAESSSLTVGVLSVVNGVDGNVEPHTTSVPFGAFNLYPPVTLALAANCKDYTKNTCNVTIGNVLPSKSVTFTTNLGTPTCEACDDGSSSDHIITTATTTTHTFTPSTDSMVLAFTSTTSELFTGMLTVTHVDGIALEDPVELDDIPMFYSDSDGTPPITVEGSSSCGDAQEAQCTLTWSIPSTVNTFVIASYYITSPVDCMNGTTKVGTFAVVDGGSTTDALFTRETGNTNDECTLMTSKPAITFTPVDGEVVITTINQITLDSPGLSIPHPVVSSDQSFAMTGSSDCDDYTSNQCSIQISIIKDDIAELTFRTFPFGISQATQVVCSGATVSAPTDPSDAFSLQPTDDAFTPGVITCSFPVEQGPRYPAQPVEIDVLHEGQTTPESVTMSWPSARYGTPLTITSSDSKCRVGLETKCEFSFQFGLDFTKLTFSTTYNGFTLPPNENVECIDADDNVIGKFTLTSDDLLTFTKSTSMSGDLKDVECNALFTKGSTASSGVLQYYLDDSNDLYDLSVPSVVSGKFHVSTNPGDCLGNVFCPVTYTISKTISVVTSDVNHFGMLAAFPLQCIADDDTTVVFNVQYVHDYTDNRQYVKFTRVQGVDDEACTINYPLSYSSLRVAANVDFQLDDDTTASVELPSYYRIPPFNLAPAFCRAKEICNLDATVHSALVSYGGQVVLTFPAGLLESVASRNNYCTISGVTENRVTISIAALPSLTTPCQFSFQFSSASTTDKFTESSTTYCTKYVVPDVDGSGGTIDGHEITNMFMTTADDSTDPDAQITGSCANEVVDQFLFKIPIVYPVVPFSTVESQTCVMAGDPCDVTYTILQPGITTVRMVNYYDIPQGIEVPCTYVSSTEISPTPPDATIMRVIDSDYVILTLKVAPEDIGTTAHIFPAGYACKADMPYAGISGSFPVEHSYEFYKLGFNPVEVFKVYHGHDIITTYAPYHSHALKYTWSLAPNSENSYISFELDILADEPYPIQIRAISFPMLTDVELEQTICFPEDPVDIDEVHSFELSSLPELKCSSSLQRDSSIFLFDGTEARSATLRRFYVLLSTKDITTTPAIIDTATIGFTAVNSSGVERQHIVTIPSSPEGGTPSPVAKPWKPSVYLTDSKDVDDRIFFLRTVPTTFYIDFAGFEFQTNDLITIEFQIDESSQGLHIMQVYDEDGDVIAPPDQVFERSILGHKLVYRYTGTDASPDGAYYTILYDDNHIATTVDVSLTLTRMVDPVSNHESRLTLQHVIDGLDVYIGEFVLTQATFAMYTQLQPDALTTTQYGLADGKSGEIRLFPNIYNFLTYYEGIDNWPEVTVNVTLENVFTDDVDNGGLNYDDTNSEYPCRRELRDIKCDIDVETFEEMAVSHFYEIPIFAPQSTTENYPAREFVVHVKFNIKHTSSEVQQEFLISTYVETIPFIRPDTLQFVNNDMICDVTHVPVLLAGLDLTGRSLPAEFAVTWPSNSPFRLQQVSTADYDITQRVLSNNIQNVIRIKRVPVTGVVPIYASITCPVEYDLTQLVNGDDNTSKIDVSLLYYSDRADPDASITIKDMIPTRYYHFGRVADMGRYITLDVENTIFEVGSPVVIPLRMQVTVLRNTIIQLRIPSALQQTLMEITQPIIYYDYNTFDGDNAITQQAIGRMAFQPDDSSRIYIMFNRDIRIYDRHIPSNLPQEPIPLQFLALNHYNKQNLFIDRCQSSTCTNLDSVVLNIQPALQYHSEFYLEHGFPTNNTLYINRDFHEGDTITLQFAAPFAHTALSTEQSQLFSLAQYGLGETYTFTLDTTASSDNPSIIVKFNTLFTSNTPIVIPIYANIPSTPEPELDLDHHGLAHIEVDIKLKLSPGYYTSNTPQFKISAPLLPVRAIELIQTDQFYRQNGKTMVSFKINRDFLMGQEIHTLPLPLNREVSEGKYDGYTVLAGLYNAENAFPLTIIATRSLPAGSIITFPVSMNVQVPPVVPPPTPGGDDNDDGEDGDGDGDDNTDPSEPIPPPNVEYLFPQNVVDVVNNLLPAPNRISYPDGISTRLEQYHWQFSSFALGRRKQSLLNFVSSDYVVVYQPFQPELSLNVPYVVNTKAQMSIQLPQDIDYAQHCIVLRFKDAGYKLVSSDASNKGTSSDNPVQTSTYSWYIEDSAFYLSILDKVNPIQLTDIKFTSTSLNPRSVVAELHSSTDCAQFEGSAMINGPIILDDQIDLRFFQVNGGAFAGQPVAFGFVMDFPILNIPIFDYAKTFAITLPSPLKNLATNPFIPPNSVLTGHVLLENEAYPVLRINVTPETLLFTLLDVSLSILNEPIIVTSNAAAFGRATGDLPCASSSDTTCAMVSAGIDPPPQNQVVASNIPLFTVAELPSNVMKVSASVFISREKNIELAWINEPNIFQLTFSSTSIIFPDFQIAIPKTYDLYMQTEYPCENSVGGPGPKLLYSSTDDDYHYFVLATEVSRASPLYSDAYTCFLLLIPTAIPDDVEGQKAKIIFNDDARVTDQTSGESVHPDDYNFYMPMVRDHPVGYVVLHGFTTVGFPGEIEFNLPRMVRYDDKIIATLPFAYSFDDGLQGPIPCVDTNGRTIALFTQTSSTELQLAIDYVGNDFNCRSTITPQSLYNRPAQIPVYIEIGAIARPRYSIPLHFFGEDLNPALGYIRNPVPTVVLSGSLLTNAPSTITLTGSQMAVRYPGVLRTSLGLLFQTADRDNVATLPTSFFVPCYNPGNIVIAEARFIPHRTDTSAAVRMDLTFITDTPLTDTWSCSLDVIPITEPTSRVPTVRYFNGTVTLNVNAVDNLTYFPALSMDIGIHRALRPPSNMSSFTFYYDTRRTLITNHIPLSSYISFPFPIETLPPDGVFCAVDGGPLVPLPFELTAQNNVVTTFTIPTERLISPVYPHYAKVQCYLPNISTSAQPSNLRGRFQFARDVVNGRIEFDNIFDFQLGVLDGTSIKWLDETDPVDLSFRLQSYLFFKITEADILQSFALIHNEKILSVMTSLADTLSDESKLELVIQTDPACYVVEDDTDPLFTPSDTTSTPLVLVENNYVGQTMITTQSITGTSLICRVGVEVTEIASTADSRLSLHVLLPHDQHAHYPVNLVYVPTIQTHAQAVGFNSPTKITYTLYGFESTGGEVTINLSNGGYLINPSGPELPQFPVEVLAQNGLTSENNRIINSDAVEKITVTGNNVIKLEFTEFEPATTYTINVYAYYPYPATKPADLDTFELASMTVKYGSEESTQAITHPMLYTKPSVNLVPEPSTEREPTDPLFRGKTSSLYIDFTNFNIMPGSQYAIDLVYLSEPAELESDRESTPISRHFKFPTSLSSSPGIYCYDMHSHQPIAAVTLGYTKMDTTAGLTRWKISPVFLFVELDENVMEHGNTDETIFGIPVPDGEILTSCYVPLNVYSDVIISTINPDGSTSITTQVMGEFTSVMYSVDTANGYTEPSDAVIYIPGFEPEPRYDPKFAVSFDDRVFTAGAASQMTIAVDNMPLPYGTIILLQFVAVDTQVKFPFELASPSIDNLAAPCYNAFYPIRQEYSAIFSGMDPTGDTARGFGVKLGGYSDRFLLRMTTGMIGEPLEFRCSTTMITHRAYPGTVNILARMGVESEILSDTDAWNPIKFVRVGQISRPVGVQTAISVASDQPSAPLEQFTVSMKVAAIPTQFNGLISIDLNEAYLSGFIECAGYPSATFTTLYDYRKNTRSPTLIVPLSELGEADLTINCIFLATRYGISDSNHVLQLYRPGTPLTTPSAGSDQVVLPTLVIDDQTYTQYATHPFKLIAPQTQSEPTVIHEFKLFFPVETYVDGNLRKKFYEIVVKYVQYRVSSSIEHLTATLDPDRIYMVEQTYERNRRFTPDGKQLGRLTIRLALRDLDNQDLIVTDRLDMASYRAEIAQLLQGEIEEAPTFSEGRFYAECEVLSRCGGNCERCIDNDVCYLDTDCRSGYCQQFIERGIDGRVISTTGLCAPAPAGYFVV